MRWVIAPPRPGSGNRKEIGDAGRRLDYYNFLVLLIFLKFCVFGI
jgi:hypothetical protein